MRTIAPPNNGTTGFGHAEPPPTLGGENGGGGRGWVELAWATDDIEAHLLVGRLTEAGIETNTIKDRGYPGAFLYGGHNPWAPVAILVRALQLEDARIVLAELAYQGPAAPPPRPPREEPKRKGRLLWWAAATALALLFTGLGLANSLERCEQAGLCEQSDAP
jgi:hypothetical protein